jgi:NAD-dependent DNA ligase
MTLLVWLLLVVVLVVWAISRAASAQRDHAALERLQAAAAIEEARAAAHELSEGLREGREDLEEAFADFQRSLRAQHEAATRQVRPSGRRRNAALNAVLEMKAAPPDRTRRDGYWTRPSVPVVTDDQVIARLAALRQLGQPAEICFTGWTDQEKAELRADAALAGCTVRSNIAHHLSFLCVGETPGQVKMDDAAERGVALISGDQFDRLVCGNEARDIPF